MAAASAWPPDWRQARVIRAHGLLRVVSFTDGDPRIALLGDAPDAAAELDAIEEAHARISVRGVARSSQRGEWRGQSYLSFECDAVCDLEHIVRAAARSRAKCPYGGAVAMSDQLMDVFEAAHDAGVAPLGVLGWGNVLVGRTGQVWIFGFGHNFPCRSVDGSARVGTANVTEAPELSIGETASEAADVYVLHALVRSLLPYVDVAPVFGRANDIPALAVALQSLGADCLALVPSGRPQNIAELRQRYRAIRSVAPYIPAADFDALASWLAALASEQGNTPTKLRVDGARRTIEKAGAPIVDLSRHTAEWRVLAELLRRLEEEPGSAIPAADLERAGWPGEQLRGRSGRDRLYVTISSLRKKLLGDALASRDGGYAIDVDVSVEWLRERPSE